MASSLSSLSGEGLIECVPVGINGAIFFVVVVFVQENTLNSWVSFELTIKCCA